MYNAQPTFQNIVQSQRVVNDGLMDTVSEIRWNKDLFVTSSWDGYIRFYQTQLQSGYRANIQVDFKTAIDCQEPILSVCWKQDMSMVFAALADNTIRAYDIKTQNNAIIGMHDDCPARQVFWNEDLKLIISLGLDKKLRFWNLQANGLGKPQPAFQLDLQHIPTVGEQSGNEKFFAYADIDNKFRWLNWSVLRGNQNSGASRSFFNMEDNYLQGQISCVGITENASQLAYATVDGRAIVKFINSIGELSTKLQFKCYKEEEEQKVSQYRTEKISRMYMCNTFQFNCRSSNWASTCGSEGTLAFWDIGKKNKILGVKLDGPIVAGQVSQDGQIFAYATGYDWAQGLDKVGEFTNRVGVAYIDDKFIPSY
ncbi:unnamed protein product [Paramecium pentaurelia]|uniref:Uncharacterized protein n=1 Tax=Paramecium pentaurelia TaxID=43138 RepID=A0A8S1YCQ1_9CILI|nr:unnamed protein product [Paramecium pentaurelia]